MLSAEDNDLVCRVGPGTKMGNLMRQYWIPGILSTELPGPDCAPLRVKLLGEELIAFRDTSGRVGVVANSCPHRGASMFFGRNEEDGLRCVYHGWKFDVTGACVDMPSEPAESNFKSKVRAKAYPCVERNGAVWVYMGPKAVPPPLPDIEATLAEGYHTIAIEHDHNWLQVLEGTIDTIHAGFLHWGSLHAEDYPQGSTTRAALSVRNASWAVANSDAGCFMGAHRPAGPGQEYWRIAAFLFPFYGMSPTGGTFQTGIPTSLTAAVPMDDDHTMYVHFIAAKTTPGYDLLPRTSDWYGRFNAPQNSGNDYMIDREAQRRNEGSNGYTGISGGRAQDRAITSSMGHIYDRTHEHLGQTDAGIIRTRKLLIDAAEALAKDGTIPPGVNNPEAYRIRTGEIFLPEGTDWVEATRELRKSPLAGPPIAVTV
jgi:phenylpropionate dioxygenase-like ring-hydroxylating dioxygenase large terminal subunit